MLKITQTMINQHSTLIDLRSKLIEIPTEQKECLHHLSYPFIPFLDENFYSSKNKVLLVGQETKGWQSRLSNFLNEDINFDTVGEFKIVFVVIKSFTLNHLSIVVFYNF